MNLKANNLLSYPLTLKILMQNRSGIAKLEVSASGQRLVSVSFGIAPINESTMAGFRISSSNL